MLHASCCGGAQVDNLAGVHWGSIEPGYPQKLFDQTIYAGRIVPEFSDLRGRFERLRPAVRIASGVRSSCAAFAVNWRWTANACSRRSSARLTANARGISSVGNASTGAAPHCDRA